MSPTFKLSDPSLTFKRVLRLSHVEGFFKRYPGLNRSKDNYPKVWFADYDKELGSEKCGVAIVVQGGEKLLYCEAFTNYSFSRTWLYTSFGYLFHKCTELAEVIKEKQPVEIYIVRSASPENAKSTATDINDKNNLPKLGNNG